MNRLGYLTREIAEGKSITRAFLNLRLSQEILTGDTIDIGGGKNSDYISFMKRDDVVFKSFDIKAGETTDFEKDVLPCPDDAYDTVLFLNVMEHIFNYQHIANEVVRITKKEGQLIGFVPFLMWYHPDHSDFFRYTHESLHKIFLKAGAQTIHVEPVALGPFMASCHMILLSFPRFVRVPIFILFYLFDKIFLYFRPDHGDRFALGYYFLVRK